MLSVHLAFQNEKTRSALSGMLRSAGLPLGEVHESGAAVIRAIRQRGGGLVLCDEFLNDLTARQLQDALPGLCKVMVLCRGVKAINPDNGLFYLPLPQTPSLFQEQVRALLQQEEAAERTKRAYRTKEENTIIESAKHALMAHLSILETDAHKMLQHLSMRNNQKMKETAISILTTYKETEQ